MEWLNYHHLLYFWTVVREGSIARACEKLHLAQPTISGQLRKLERSLRAKLFERVGRNLVVTDVGQEVFRYADEIFTLGRELQATVAGRPAGRQLRLMVGVVDALPKLVSYHLIEPALRLAQPVQVICQDGPPDQLLAQLAMHHLDLVLSDAPVSPVMKIRAFSHLLGECGVSFVGAAKLASVYRRRFPRSLDGAPMLLPVSNTTLRRSLDNWFEEIGIRPQVRGEFADSALLKSFGQAGAGVFVVPRAVEKEVRSQYQVRLLGRVDGIQERFYAISVDRKLKHPGVVAISEGAKRKLFGTHE